MFSVFEWFILVLQCKAFVVIVLSDEPRQNQGRGLVDRKLVHLPPHSSSNFIAGRPKRLLSFGPLVVLDLVFRYKNRKWVKVVV